MPCWLIKCDGRDECYETLFDSLHDSKRVKDERKKELMRMGYSPKGMVEGDFAEKLINERMS
ncbi:MAG: hypothetical protein JSV25_00880 [Spirochaetota bacterium]|nr:MAG: hypothetical protein JSV25_00880 [Spirochaetota bacterium]